MELAMKGFRFAVGSASRNRHDDFRKKFRNPPLGWRRIAVGTILAVPGFVGGLMAGLLLPLPWAIGSAIAGAVIGFIAGVYVERD